ncbi:MAG TPA: NADH-ubiquinone oxidoreductase-F iron-sulfur binding region domain-containing protein [bacterium]|nr:NADH-ubiquinone oxidoreductase-F iron-sulfur binding region domain-containing protein [bacterium]
MHRGKRILIKDTGATGPDRTREFYSGFLKHLVEKKLDDAVQPVRVADIGLYDAGVVVHILPDDIVYAGVEEKDVAPIVSQTVCEGKTIKRLLHEHRSLQTRIVLRNCGVIDPENIDDYIGVDGYAAAAKVLGGMTPEETIGELKISGLRGRGGGGYPTWKKWEFTLNVDADQKFVICNGDEGDPGAYMDRSVLEGDPHSVLEGMIIAGFAVRAGQGYVYIRAEYPLAIKRVQHAIDQAYARGLLGKNILESGFDFDIEIRLGAGAFVCGEETALIASIEGKRGYPSPRPPYPAVKGLWGKPTVINNVETLANVPRILLKGGEWFSGIGRILTKGASRGTKVFALTGKVRNSGLIEVPMGTTLKEIVFEIGGGVARGRALKAVQTGGPSGGVISSDFINIPVGYEKLQKLGSIMGSGGMIVMDEDDCLVDIAKFYLRFCVDESCGKCAPCRIGGVQLLRILTRITDGEGRVEDLEKLRTICHAMQKASLCGLGQTAPNPVLSTLNYFEDEYREHIERRHCPAGRCQKLFSYAIDQDKCKRCGLCIRHCPVHCIAGNRETGFVINSEECIRCGRCFAECKFDAIQRD